MTKAKKRTLLVTIASIFALAGPTMLEQVLHTLVQYIDTAMVGSLGTEATASVGATTTVSWLFNSTVSAVGVGFLAFISQSIGAGETATVKKASAQAVFMVLVLGGFFTLVALILSPFVPVWMQVDESIRETSSIYFFIIYTPMLFRTASIIFGTILRSVRDTKTPMRVGLVVNLINVVLNFLFIYDTRVISLPYFIIIIPGLNLGVIGAGIASSIAFTVGGILMFIAVLRHPVASFKGESIKPNREILKPCLKIALPNALQRFGTSFGYVAFASMVNSLGEIATASHTIANTVESAFYIPGYGMQSASSTLVGNAYGANNKKEIEKTSRAIILIEASLMVVSGALLFIFAPQMMKIFSSDKEVIELGSLVLRMVALSEPFYGVSIVVEGMMHGMGKTVMPFITNIVGMWLIRIVGTYIVTQVFSFGLVGAWGCMILHNLMLFVVFISFYCTKSFAKIKIKKT